MRKIRKTLQLLHESRLSYAAISRAIGVHKTTVGKFALLARAAGIGFMTPHSVHYGYASDIRVKRQDALDAAFLAHPQRFKDRRPRPHALPTAAWINPPKQESLTAAINTPPCAVN